MSPLTKLFVVLLVIFSMLLTAATVVFVARTQNYQESSKQREAALDEANAKAARATADANAARDQAARAVSQGNAQVEALNQRINDLNRQLGEKGVQAADLSNKVQIQALALTQATEGQKAAQDLAAKLQDQSSTLRTTVDKLTQDNADLTSSNSDLTNKLEVTTRDMRFYKEQLAEAQKNLDRYAARLQNLGVQPGDVTGQPAAPTPAISGTIQDKRDIGGVPYATINVGASDSVTKGMQFNVVDSSRGLFLGKLTVDTVEPREASGRLEGPRVNEIQRGNEVKTQL